MEATLDSAPQGDVRFTRTITLDDNIVSRYYPFMIASFRCRETEKIFQRRFSRRFPRSVQRVAMRKLWILHAALNVNDLRMPPGNRLEALRGRRKGQHSIRINDQWRICFRWQGTDAFEVEIVDYH